MKTKEEIKDKKEQQDKYRYLWEVSCEEYYKVYTRKLK